MTNTKTAQLRMRRSQRIRVLHPLTNAFDMRYGVLIVFVVVAMVLAFQSPPAVDIGVGSLGDRLFLQSSAGLGEADAALWYGDEISSDAASGRSRWTRQVATVDIPMFDTTSDISLMVRVAGWPATVKHGALTQPKVTIQVNGTTTTVFTPTAEFADYYFVLPATLGRDSALQLQIKTSDVFTQTTTGSDIRPKGVRVERIAAATPNDWVAWSNPSWLLLVAGILFATLVYVWAMMLFRRPMVALSVSLVLLTGLTVAMAFQRIYVVAGAPYLLGVMGVWVLWLLRRDVIQMIVTLRNAFGRGASIGIGLMVTFAAVITMALQSLGIASFFAHPIWQFGTIWAVVMLLLTIGILRPVAGVTTWLDVRWRSRGEWLFGVVLLGIVVLAGLIVQAAPFIGHADYADNAVVARNLLQGRGWVVDYVTQFYRIYPNVTRPQETWPLLQPVWIAAAFLLVGVNDIAARIPNVIFLMVALGLVWRTSVTIWDKRVGVIAVILAAGNIFIYRQMIYATSDLAFMAFHLGAMGAIFGLRLPVDPHRNVAWWQTRVVRVVGAGVWTGLMLLQKPGSGGMSAIGFGLWLLYEYRATFTQPLITTRLDRLRNNLRQYAERLWPVVLWALVALVCVSPYAERNIRLFGSPGYTTEQTDTWLLEYTNWDAIYRVYAPDGGIGSGDIPDRSWLLRWGFDGVALKLMHQVGAIRDYVMPSFGFLPNSLHPLGAAENATGLLADMALWFMLIGIIVWQNQLSGMLRRLVSIGFAPYVVFMVIYWHANEPRYWVPLLPWMAMFAAAGMIAVYDKARQWFNGRLNAIALLGLLAVVGLSVHPSITYVQNRQAVDAQMVAADLDMYAFLRNKTPLSAVMMTRVPWQLNWYAERPAVMIPSDANAQTLLRLAGHYQARYLVLDALQRPNTATRAMIAAMIADPAIGMKEVYRTPEYPVNDAGRTYTMQSVVYEFPSDYAGATPIR